MNTTVPGGRRYGRVKIPASKSHVHRLLIAAALGDKEVNITFDGLSKDIAATLNCLEAMGAVIKTKGEGSLTLSPITAPPQGLCTLNCGESGSTLRFLLPIVGALGIEAQFVMEGRLPQRPLAPLDGVLCAHGMTLSLEGNCLSCHGQLSPGEYSIAGNVSSQYVTGLLMALPLLEGDSLLRVTGEVESAPYIAITEGVLAQGGIAWEKRGWDYAIPGGQRCSLPESCAAEGDWSNAAFFFAMGALSPKGVTVEGLSLTSRQGDKAVLDILEAFGACVTRGENSVTVSAQSLRGTVIDAAPIPDLIPPLAVVAAAAEGETRIINAARLRLKESDRLKSTADLLTRLGAEVTELEDGLIIRGGKPLRGAQVPSWGDHRIAMSAALAAGLCTAPITVTGSECTAKSYPRFWEDISQLKGEDQ